MEEELSGFCLREQQIFSPTLFFQDKIQHKKVLKNQEEINGKFNGSSSRHSAIL